EEVGAALPLIAERRDHGSQIAAHAHAPLGRLRWTGLVVEQEGLRLTRAPGESAYDTRVCSQIAGVPRNLAHLGCRVRVCKANRERGTREFLNFIYREIEERAIVI